MTWKHVTAILLFFVMLVTPSSVHAESLLLPPLRKPTWSDCTVQGQRFACLSFEETKHYVSLYQRYSSLRKQVRLLDEALQLQDTALKLSANLGTDLQQQLQLNNEALKELRLYVENDDTKYTAGDVVWYSGLAGLVGLTGGTLLVLVLK